MHARTYKLYYFIAMKIKVRGKSSHFFKDIQHRAVRVMYRFRRIMLRDKSL